MELPSKVGERLGVGRFGPEGGRDALALHGRAARVEDQEGDELLLPRGGNAGERPPVGEDAKVAEQFHAQRGRTGHVCTLHRIGRASAVSE